MESRSREIRTALLHVPAVCAVYFLMHAFGETAMRLPAALYRAGIPGLMLYLVLDLLNVWAAVFLYARYILKKTLSEIGLGKPFFHRYWCLAAVVLAAAQNGFYLVFAKGELYRWDLGFQEQLSLLFSNLFIQGLRLAVMDGLLFRALVPAVFEKAGRKGMVVASSLMYAAVLLLSEPASFWSAGRFLLEFTALFLKGMSLILTAMEAGSVWPSVLLDAVLRAFGGDAHILHIDTEQAFPAVFAYTLESDSWMLAGLPGTFSLHTAFPALAGSVAVILAALFRIKTRAQKKCVESSIRKSIQKSMGKSRNSGKGGSISSQAWGRTEAGRKTGYFTGRHSASGRKTACFTGRHSASGRKTGCFAGSRIRRRIFPDDLTGSVLEHLLNGTAAGLYLMLLLYFGGRNLMQQYFFQYDTKEAALAQELGEYARKYHITAENAQALFSWTEQQQVQELMIAREGWLIFHADYPGKLLSKRRKMPSGTWRPWHYVEFADGGADVYVSTGFDEKYDYMLLAFSVLAGFASCLGIVASGMHRQLLEKERTEKELRRAQEKLVLGMSHDLRTPLTGLLAYMEVIKKQEAGAGSSREYVEKAYHKILQIKELSDQLFEYFLADSQKGIQLEPPEEISSALGDYLSELCALLDCSGFRVHMQMPEWKPVFIRVNTDYLGRIMNNLYSNLEKYADRNQEVVIQMIYEPDRAGIVIQNSMAQAGPYEGGTGIGVSNICLMMEQMGGQAQADMTEQVYRMILYFPVCVH